jgi:hypothetical protein
VRTSPRPCLCQLCESVGLSTPPPSRSPSTSRVNPLAHASVVPGVLLRPACCGSTGQRNRRIRRLYHGSVVPGGHRQLCEAPASAMAQQSWCCLPQSSLLEPQCTLPRGRNPIWLSSRAAIRADPQAPGCLLSAARTGGSWLQRIGRQPIQSSHLGERQRKAPAEAKQDYRRTDHTKWPEDLVSLSGK